MAQSTTQKLSQALTKGIHHLGLTVSRLEASAAFFIDTLGWREVRHDPAYPAIFVSDGSVMVTLWQVKEQQMNDPPRPINFKDNPGLHHVAFQVPDRATLEAVYQRVAGAPDVKIEFSPELLRDGPAMHMMCYEPSGIRVEFIWAGQ